MNRSTAVALALGSLATFAACSGSSDSSPAADVDAGGSSGDDASVADAIASIDANGEAASPSDTGASSDAPIDAGDENACEWGGAPGECITTAACSALADHTSYAGQCPGAADIQCCIVTPNPADNPPTPAGWVLMKQADVTADMTTWAVAILDDPTTYPMFATTTKQFAALLVLARVEWHPADFQNAAIHRGVTLYEPAD